MHYSEIYIIMRPIFVVSKFELRIIMQSFQIVHFEI